jgi:hypothetical protein
VRRLFLYLLLIVAALAPTLIAFEATASDPASTAPKANSR